MGKPPARWAGGITALLCATALVDDLGKFYWFWPYDGDVLPLAALVGLLWLVIFSDKVQAWARKARAKHDREDYPDEFKDS
jgi:hypothetical protein